MKSCGVLSQRSDGMAEAGRSTWTQGQPGLQSELQDSKGNTETPYLKNTKQNVSKVIFIFQVEKNIVKQTSGRATFQNKNQRNKI